MVNKTKIVGHVSCGACGWTGRRSELVLSSPHATLITWHCPECNAGGNAVGPDGTVSGVPSLEPGEIVYVTDRFCSEHGERYRRNLIRFYHWLRVFHTSPYENQPWISVRFINNNKHPDSDWAATRSGLLSDALIYIRKYQREYRLGETP